MSVARACRTVPARGRSGLARAIAAHGKRQFYVVCHPKDGVQCVIIPDSLKGTDFMISHSVGPFGCYSKQLTELWGRGSVWGQHAYLDVMEKLVDPPFPHHTVCTLS